MPLIIHRKFREMDKKYLFTLKLGLVFSLVGSQNKQAEAAQKLRTAQLALGEAKPQGREELASARERARLVTIEETEARAVTRGQMAMTGVVSEEHAASGDSSYSPVFSPNTDTNRDATPYLIKD